MSGGVSVLEPFNVNDQALTNSYFGGGPTAPGGAGGGDKEAYQFAKTWFSNTSFLTLPAANNQGCSGGQTQAGGSGGGGHAGGGGVSIIDHSANGTEAPRSLDKYEGAPVLAVAIPIAGLPVPGGDNDERTAGEVIGAPRFKLRADVAGDAHEVLHHGEGVTEDMPIELLVQVADARAPLVEGGEPGFVNVPELEGLGVEQLAVDLELPGDAPQRLFLECHNVIEYVAIVKLPASGIVRHAAVPT